MKSLNYLNKYLWKYKSYLFWGTIFVIISNFFSIIPAQIVRFSFDLIRDNVDLFFLYDGFEHNHLIYNIFAQAVLIYGVLILAMAILRGIFLFFVRQTLIVMSRVIEYDLKNEIYLHYQTLPLSFYRRNNTGDLMARISEDVSQVRMYLGPAIMYGLNMITLFVMVVTYMFWVDIELSFYTLLPLPILSISIYFVNNLINARSEAIQRQLSRLSTYTQEAFAGIRVLKAFSREEESAKGIEKESEAYKQKALELMNIQAYFFPLILALIGVSTLLTTYIGGLEVMNGTISMGNIAEFIIYVNMLTWPVTSLGWITSITQQAAASQTRINEFLNTKTDIISEKQLEKEIKGHIQFEGVTLIYPDSGIEALKNISFQLEAGKSLAILGTTGAGKTTIANLLFRMYDPSKGEIKIDQQPLKDYQLTHLRKQMGYVPQDVFLFSDTIANNITFGLPHADFNDETLHKAAADADLMENIQRFPEGFETRVGERGITLSGGQKQRVSIARAIIRQPKILILDDALSAVDTKTENAILNNLKRIMQDRTTIIISHRISSAKLADYILMLDDGEIVERGTHEELLQKNGAYKELHEKQLQQNEEV
ncbi:MAG: ABC transporter ATP-binding protein [Cytophagales bacterium]|nr:MAG: ABC transporter ATP-binding protein [Cytophagales bacterium]